MTSLPKFCRGPAAVLLPEAGPSDGAVDEELRSEGVGCPDRGQLREGVAGTEAAIAEAIATGCAKAELALHECVHDAIFAPDLVLFAPVPVDLGIHVVAVEALGSLVEVILQIARTIGLGNQRGQLRDGRVEARGRDDVDPASAGKHDRPVPSRLPE